MNLIVEYRYCVCLQDIIHLRLWFNSKRPVQGGLFGLWLLRWVSQPLLEVSLHLLPLLGGVVIHSGDDLLRTKELYKLTQLRETAVFTVWDAYRHVQNIQK